MAVILYGAGAAHARSLIEAGNYDNTAPWSFSAEDGAALLGTGGDDWANFGRFHLGEDTAATEKTKARYKYPHGKAGKVYGGALRAIRSRASQQNETAIFDEAGKLLDLVKEKEGTAGRRNLSSQGLPAYDPDGDGDNDAEEAVGLINSARLLLDEAMDCLTSTTPDDDAMARSRHPVAAGGAVVLPFKKPAAKSVLRVRAQGTDTAEMDLFGVVGGDFWGDGGITKEQFAQTLRQLPAGVKRVDMRLSSPGGDVFDGRAIANMMKDHPAAFDVNIVAEASSIASIIAMAGDTVKMGEGAVMLVHRCYAFTIGNCNELRQQAQDLETIDASMIQTYARRTGMKPADIVALMDENRYMSADEAKQLGFVDSIATELAIAMEPLRIAALSIDRKRFHLPPLPAANQPRRLAALAAIQRMKAAAA